jgi:hypothetical protein
MTKSPKVRIHSLEEGDEIQDKGITNLFNEIMVETFPYQCNNIDINVQEEH